MKTPSGNIFSLAVLVAALGYFVDIYDLLLFSIIRIPSLQSFGLSKEEITAGGEAILSFQMWGLLLGGVLWGVLGDKKGRLSVLFGSILLYSIANILNGFVTNVEQYKWIRFAAGIGLAGELGAGITLVSELTEKEKRGLATSFVAGIGLTGAVVAFLMKQNFEWRTCYFIGGGLGLALLLLRISVYESGLYEQIKSTSFSRGNFFQFFTNRKRFFRYMLNILIGLPTWLVIGVLVTFSGEFAESMQVNGKVDPGRAIMYAYAAIAVGDVLIGFVSQWFKSRKKALYIFYLITILFIVLFFTTGWNSSPERIYWICAGLGFGTGFWAIFVTMAAEQFGTNLRATAATTIPNMVRGMLAVLILPLFKTIRLETDYFTSGWITSLIIMLISLCGVVMISETFHKDLNFVEE
jgi:MFS family permease